VGIQAPITIRFLQALDAGVYGAVAKALATAEDTKESEVIAFKMFMINKRGERVGTQKEIDIMDYLSKNMPEVLAVKLGPIMHSFVIDNVAYHGFGMELFEHGTVHAYFKEILKTVPEDIPSRIAFLIDPGPLRQLYTKCMEAIKKMWLLGVIHCDLHINNILYDQANDTIKIIDFGMSYQPKRGEELQFQLGTVYDYIWFTKSFVRWVLYPSGLQQKRDDAQVHSIMLELSPELISFTRGELPSTSDWDEIYASFLRRYGLSGPRRRPWAAGIKYAALGKAPKFELNEALGGLRITSGTENTPQDPVPHPNVQQPGAQPPVQPGLEVSQSSRGGYKVNPISSPWTIIIVAVLPSFCILNLLHYPSRKKLERLLDSYEEI